MITWIAIGFFVTLAATGFGLWRYLSRIDKRAAPWILCVALTVATPFPAPALDRKTLDGCEAKLGALYEGCKREHTPSECNRGLTTRLCGAQFWNEPYAAFLDRRIEESAAPGMPYAFTGLTKLKTTYAVAGSR
jgi:hypothetical protein